MDKLLAFLPTLLAFLGRANTLVPPVVSAVGTIIGAIEPFIHSDVKPAPLDVKWLQTKLKALGYDPGTIDGVYGEKTKTAVMTYQTAKNLVADGWAGVTTTAALVAEKVT